MKMNTRNSSIELLRILAGMAIIVLHFNYSGEGGVLASANGATFAILMLLEIVCICAVNIFIMITGYFTSDSEKLNFGKILSLILQTSAFSFGFKLLQCIIKGTIDIKGLLFSCLPINYYVIFYCTMMCIVPYANRMLKTLKTKQLKCFMIMIFYCFLFILR